MPTIACPTCGKSLNVPAELLGKKVKCSACQGVFTAEAEVAPPTEPERRPPREEEEDRPRRRPRDEEDLDAERPRRRPRDEDDEDEYRPRRRHRDFQPHRGTMILVLGILGLVVCGPLGIAAWVMGNNDMRAIRAGRMDPEGESTTNIGRILGIIATCFLILQFCMVIVYMIFIFGVIGAGAAGAAGRH